jgi:hypothetical protein|tara:strand:- start:36 stop:284 length:249 start_codon:yes stop_codon:yes gene_type:complete
MRIKSIIYKLIIDPVSELISRWIIKKCKKTFKRKIEAEVLITENEVWKLLQTWRKCSNVSVDDYILVSAFVKYLLIKINLRK